MQPEDVHRRQPQLRHEDLLALTGDSVLLMPSDASARQTRNRLAELRGSHDQAFVESLTVVPLDQWLATLWDDSFPERQVLRPIQLLALARQIIESSEYYPRQCLNSLAICRQFVDAFQLFHAWQLSDQREHYLFSSEYQAFYAWRLALQHKLDEQDALSSQQLPAALTEILRRHPTDLPLPRQVIVSPDLELTPAVLTFLQACEERGQCHCHPLARDAWGAATTANAPTLRSFATRREECRTVAADIADYLGHWKEGRSPVLAIVSVDTELYRGPLQSALGEVLYPAALFPRQQQLRDQSLAEPWLFEGSEKLLGFPLISAAWELISLTRAELPLEQLSRLLRSRFIHGWSEYRCSRASLDLHWRDQLNSQTTLAAALAISRRAELVTPELLAPLRAIDACLAGLPGRQLPSAWVRSFDQLLLQAGWPNAAEDDPVVQQCRRGFSQAMDVFRAMDRQLGEIDHGVALSWLQPILATKRFSISRDWECPIAIMGLDDALGRRFDAIWLLGLDDAALPRRAEPSAFLPLALQLRGGMTDAEPGRVLIREQRLLRAVLTGTDQLAISYCRESDSGVPLEPSSLLKEWVAGVQTAPASVSAAAYRIGAAIERPQSESVAAVTAAEKARLRGGSGLFKEYAISPFFAFARYRLRLREFPQTLEGLDHRLQGILVHASLQGFWQQTRDKAGLDRLAERALVERVEGAVVQAMQDPEVAGWRFPEALLAIEKSRVVELIIAWLTEKERARSEDFTVVAMEEERRAELYGIPLRLRIDRIDEVATAEGPRRLLIDYKTGSVEGKSLNSTRLTEPQLPIYALVESGKDGGVDGVMLAQLKSVDELSLHMRSNWANSVVKKRAANNDVATGQAWHSELQAWSMALAEMAAGILAGDIRHDAGVDHRRGFSAYLLPLLRGDNGDMTGDEL